MLFRQLHVQLALDKIHPTRHHLTNQITKEPRGLWLELTIISTVRLLHTSLWRSWWILQDSDETKQKTPVRSYTLKASFCTNWTNIGWVFLGNKPRGRYFFTYFFLNISILCSQSRLCLLSLATHATRMTSHFWKPTLNSRNSSSQGNSYTHNRDSSSPVRCTRPAQPWKEYCFKPQKQREDSCAGL